MLGVDVVGLIAVVFDGLSLEGWPGPLVVVDMASLHDVHLVLIDEVLKVKG